MNKKELIVMVERYLELSEGYYNGDTIASDKEFDDLKNNIYSYSDIEEFKSIIARIDIVGATPKLPVIPHANRMYSLDNVFSLKELQGWIDKHPKETKYSLEWKYDGASLEVVYIKGGIKSAISRGDGKVGVDVFDNVFNILPKKIGDDDISIHGELIISFKEFIIANSLRVKRGERPFLSPRNAASAEMMHGNGQVKLRFVPYTLFKGQERVSTEVLDKMFPNKAIPYSKVLDKINLMKEAEKLYSVPNTHIPTDGLVIKIVDEDLVEELGFTSKFPKFAIALKFPETDVTTTLLDVAWQVGHTGVITPVGILEPVEMSDCTVSRVTLNNVKFVLTAKLGYKSKVMIIRSGGVIPKLTGVLSKPGDHLPIVIPSKCPSCNKHVTIVSTDLVCKNTECPDRVKSRLARFVSRDYADVKGVGEELVSKLYDAGIRNLVDLVTVDKALLSGIAGLKEQSITNILDAFKNIKALPMDKFLASLGVEGLGRTTSKSIALVINGVEDILTTDISSIDGIGLITNTQILTGIKSKLEEFRELEKILKPTSVSANANTVCFTGKFKTPRKELEKTYRSEGYSVVSSVTKGLTLLVAGEKPSSKLGKAKKLGINILTMS